MAAAESGDVFGDPSLFAEFDKPQEPSDRLLLENLKDGSERVIQTSQPMSESSTSTEDSDENDDENLVEIPVLFKESEISPSRDMERKQQALHPRSTLKNVNDSNISLSNLRKDIERLKKENIRLRRQRRLIEPSRFEDDDGPALQVVFMNHKIARHYKSDIEGFLADLFASNKNRRQDERVLVPSLRPNAVCLVDEVENQNNVEERAHNMRACSAIGSCQYYEDFIIDPQGWPLVEGTPALSEGWDIPPYPQVFLGVLPNDEEDDDDEGNFHLKHARPKKACFNCGENHDLKDCSLPRDYNRINQKKREFMDAKAANQPMKLQRYIPDSKEESPVRFEPGVISDTLREALGIRNDQLPPYIYQMRLLGYPPGHLLETEIEESGIAMFDRHGNEMSMTEDDGEDGEVDTTATTKSVKYNTNKLIQYPGFNVPVPEGVKDEHERLSMPAMQKEQALEILESVLAQQNVSGTKRHLSDNGTPGSSKRLKTGHLDDNEDGSSPERQLLKSQTTDDSIRDSPTLEELQKHSNLLQQELAEVEDKDTDYITTDAINSSDSNEETQSTEEDSKSATPLSRKDTSLLNSFSDSFSSSSLSVALGTPIHKSISGKRDSLPDSDKWKKDISEHIPFENLPGTTGNFERMNDLLGKLRKDRKSLTPKSTSSPKKAR